jgi:type I restriction-modification system DNA methylase subunit
VSTLTLSKLESHLWEAANILRGPVDAADFKTYVFPLLFFKRISDMQDDEYDAAMKEFDGDEESALFPENFWCHEPRISRISRMNQISDSVASYSWKFVPFVVYRTQHST